MRSRTIKKNMLGLRAQQVGLTEKHYNRTDVYLLIDDAIGTRDAFWAERITKDLLPMLSHIMNLELFMKEIDLEAAVWRGDELKAHLTLQTAGDLMAIFTPLALIAERNDVPLDEVKDRVKARFDGISRLHKPEADDDGESLRGTANQERDNRTSMVAIWRDKLKLATGAPKGRRQWSVLIGNKVAAFVSEGRNITEAARLAVEYFAHADPKTDAEKQACRRLRESVDPEELARYHYYEREKEQGKV